MTENSIDIPNKEIHMNGVSNGKVESDMTTPINSENKPQRYSAWTWIRGFTLMQMTLPPGLCQTVLMSFFPIVVKSRGWTGLDVGCLIAVFSVARIITYMVAGNRISQMGPRIAIGLWGSVGAVGVIGFAFVNNIKSGEGFAAACFSLRILEAVGLSVAYIASYGLVVRLFDRHQAIVSGINVTMVNVSRTIGPLVGSVLYSKYGFMAPFLFSGGYSQLLAIFCCIFGSTKDLPPSKTPTLDVQYTGRRKTSLINLNRNVVNVFCAFGQIFVMGGIALFDTAYAMHINSVFHIRIGMIGVYFIVPSISSMVFGIGISKVIQNFRCANPLFITVMSLWLGILSLQFVGPTAALGIPMSLGLSVFGTFLLGSTMGLFYTSSLIVQTRTALGVLGWPDHLDTYTVTIASLRMAGSLGFTVGPILGGFLSDKYGMGNACSIFSAIGAPVICAFTIYVFYMYYGLGVNLLPEIPKLDPKEVEIKQ